MATQAQIAANRANAQLSTGPSPAGIENCKHNATKFGLTGKQVVIKGENAEAYDALRAQLVAQYNPATEQEAMLSEFSAELRRVDYLPLGWTLMNNLSHF